MLSEELGANESLEFSTRSLLVTEVSAPDGKLPPEPPHRGAGHFNGDR
jgi:hypothetical protein